MILVNKACIIHYGHPAILENIRNKVPQRRLGQYGDLSGALLFLASDANTYTQGTIIVCDGGLILESF